MSNSAKNIALTLLSTTAIIATLSSCVQSGLPFEQRPSSWAQPVAIQGLPNLYQVSPVLYRAAQPDASGLILLNQKPLLTNAQTPIKTIISLRAGAPDADITPPIGVNYVQIDFDTWHVKESDVVQVLRIMNTPSMQPVLLHCKHGADRTGMMTALYRIVNQGWSKADAIAEMRQGGFGYHPMWFNLTHYINNVDVEALRKKINTPI